MTYRYYELHLRHLPRQTRQRRNHIAGLTHVPRATANQVRLQPVALIPVLTPLASPCREVMAGSPHLRPQVDRKVDQKDRSRATN